MDGKIPVPTDNIYKFLATFGLVVMVVTATLMVLNADSTNQILWKTGTEYYDLSESADPRKSEKLKILESQIKVASKNRVYGQLILSVFFAIGGLISVEGFRLWLKKVQPLSDEIRELQKEKLKLEVEQLRRSLAPDIE